MFLFFEAKKLFLFVSELLCKGKFNFDIFKASLFFFFCRHLNKLGGCVYHWELLGQRSLRSVVNPGALCVLQAALDKISDGHMLADVVAIIGKNWFVCTLQKREKETLALSHFTRFVFFHRNTGHRVW